MRELWRIWRGLLAACAPPPALYVRGVLPARRGVALVGTRKPSAEALAFARRLAAGLGEAGYAVWSGGARGIDGACPEAALGAGAPTGAVLAGGLDRPYPEEHGPLFERVLRQGGALVSLYPDGTPHRRPLFLRRNGVLAALTAATIVVQAPHISGARSTASAARRLGRPLGVVPHPPWCPHGAGCARELGLGARPINQISDALGLLAGPSPPRPQPEPAAPLLHPGDTEIVTENQALDSEEQVVFEAVGPAPQHVDELCRATGMSCSAAVRALLTLTLRGVVVEGPTGHFRRRPL
ncbi:MAG: DNA-processing protein DprA [Deltaproteobacteria bacterium]|nr:DNA-processing protein DprA [Deltaproteobacteria bacterium]